MKVSASLRPTPAGTIPPFPSLAELQAELDSADRSRLKPLHIAVLRNVTIEPMRLYLAWLLMKDGFDAQITFGGFDTAVQDALDAAILPNDTDVVLVCLRLEGLSWPLTRAFAALSRERIEEEVARVELQFARLLQAIRARTRAMVLCTAFERPSHGTFGALDSTLDWGQTTVIDRLNSSLRTLLADTSTAFLLDLNALLIRLGAAAFYDHRYWHIARAPYSREALRQIAVESAKLIRAGKGRQRKCLVLDCDNTLWGGIVGEDGVAGIQLGQSHPGSAYREFQQEALNLFHRGVILALCSKNNEEDVWEVFRQHPDMVLREEHIAEARINWQDKATNLRALATSLNIGLDSLVFADDSEYEIALVRQALPEVSVLLLPPDRPHEYRGILCACGLFDSLAVSEEDRSRGTMYKSEVLRKKLSEDVTDLDAFLCDLDLQVEIRVADHFTVPRIAQLTQKTNQFNLTNRRYTAADIEGLAADANLVVGGMRVADRFGDLGIVGVGILRVDEAMRGAEIDTLLLSCRAIGRGVETVLLRQLLATALRRGCERVFGTYVETSKNAQVRDFYPDHGFAPDGDKAAPALRYVFDLRNALPPVGNHFRSIIYAE